LETLLSKIISEKSNLNLIFRLYTYFKSNIKNNLSDSDLISLGIPALSHLNSFRLEKIELPVGDNPKNDLLYHPTKFINKQWVYIPATSDYLPLHHFIKNSLLY